MGDQTLEVLDIKVKSPGLWYRNNCKADQNKKFIILACLSVYVWKVLHKLLQLLMVYRVLSTLPLSMVKLTYLFFYLWKYNSSKFLEFLSIKKYSKFPVPSLKGAADAIGPPGVLMFEKTQL